MPETLRHITSMPAFKPATPVEPDSDGILKPPSFLRETAIIVKAGSEIRPFHAALARSRKDSSSTYHSRRGRRPRPVCPKCNRSYRRSEGHQCRGETQKFNLFPTGSLKKAA